MLSSFQKQHRHRSDRCWRSGAAIPRFPRRSWRRSPHRRAYFRAAISPTSRPYHGRETYGSAGLHRFHYSAGRCRSGRGMRVLVSAMTQFPHRNCGIGRTLIDMLKPRQCRINIRLILRSFRGQNCQSHSVSSKRSDRPEHRPAHAIRQYSPPRAICAPTNSHVRREIWERQLRSTPAGPRNGISARASSSGSSRTAVAFDWSRNASSVTAGSSPSACMMLNHKSPP